MVLNNQQLQEQGLLHQNAISGRLYSGLTNQRNLQSLNKESTKRVTLKQVMNHGWKLKEGAKSATVVYAEYEDKRGVRFDKPIITYHRVFNVQDVNITSLPKLSDKQKNYLTKLIKSHYKDDVKLRDQVLNGLDELSIKQASQLIKKLSEARECNKMCVNRIDSNYY